MPGLLKIVKHWLAVRVAMYQRMSFDLDLGLTPSGTPDMLME